MKPKFNCRGNMRHWFTVYGAPGLRAPTCQRCGAPNPRPLSVDERLAYDDHLLAFERYQRENREYDER